MTENSELENVEIAILITDIQDAGALINLVLKNFAVIFCLKSNAEFKFVLYDSLPLGTVFA